MAADTLLARLRHLVAPAHASDADLLTRYARHRDEAAFAALLERHGPMVLRLARRLLANSHDAEDAFQATFLVLARRAGAIRRRQSVAAWLHGVAYRVALKARAARDRRREQGQGPAPDPADPHPDPLAQVSARELLAALEEEVQRLPEAVRVPVVLVCLEGLSQEEAARRLGWTAGQVKGRLERGRRRLQARLQRRGLTLPAALAAAAWCRAAAGAASGALLRSTVQAASALSAGQALGGVVSPQVAALTQGVVQGMAIKQLTVATILALALGLLGVGAGALAQRPGAGPGPAGPAAEQPRPDPPPGGQEQDFRKMTPAARLAFVEKTLGEKTWYKAARGDVAAAVVQRGAVGADSATVACPALGGVRGPMIITWVIDEGSPVKKGERVLQLDDTYFRGRLKQLRPRFEAARAAAAQADEHRRLVGEQGDIDVRLAHVTVELAEIDLKRFAGKDPTEKRQLELKVEQARLLAARAKLQVRERLAQADAEAQAKKAVLDQEQRRMQELEESVKGCVLRAPRDGLAVYHVPEQVRGIGVQPQQPLIAQGEPVREGQLLLRIYDLKRPFLDVNVPEALVARVRKGQRATVLVDGYPGTKLAAEVTEVATTASQREWFANNVKVYATRLALKEGLPNLQPGMTAEVHIVTDARTNVIRLPLQAVLGAGKERYCYVKTARGVEERRLVTGLANDQVVEVVEGLEAGAEVLRDPRVLPGAGPSRKKGAR